MNHINDIETELIEKGYWKLTTGYVRNNEMTEPQIMTTPKWRKMVQELLKDNPHKIITPEEVENYIMDLS